MARATGGWLSGWDGASTRPKRINQAVVKGADPRARGLNLGSQHSQVWAMPSACLGLHSSSAKRI